MYIQALRGLLVTYSVIAMPPGFFLRMFGSIRWFGLNCIQESQISRSIGAINVGYEDIHQVAHVEGFSWEILAETELV